MVSPFDGLDIERELVCEFFAMFARFEYAMKATHYCWDDRGRAAPDWKELALKLGDGIERAVSEPPARELIDYLLSEPPQVQNFVNGKAEFQAKKLSGTNLGTKAIDGAKRVRNNLFHGGKHTPHSAPERDTKLIKAAIAVLDACLAIDPELKSEFELQRT